MKIAVLSDTHGLLRPEAAELISKCDAVIHAGDINSQKIIDEMKAANRYTYRIYIVRGNNDKEWAEHLPHYLEFTLAGMNFYVIHNKKELPSDLGDRQIIIFGHSHRYSEEKKDGRLWLNPGAAEREGLIRILLWRYFGLRGKLSVWNGSTLSMRRPGEKLRPGKAICFLRSAGF